MTTTRDLLNPQVTLVTKLQLMWGGRRQRAGEVGRLAPKGEVWEGGRGRPRPPLPGTGEGNREAAAAVGETWGAMGAGAEPGGAESPGGKGLAGGEAAGIGGGWQKGLREQRCVELLAAEQGVSSPWWSRCMGRGMKPFLPEGPSDQEGHGSRTRGWREGEGGASCFCGQGPSSAGVGPAWSPRTPWREGPPEGRPLGRTGRRGA